AGVFERHQFPCADETVLKFPFMVQSVACRLRYDPGAEQCNDTQQEQRFHLISAHLNIREPGSAKRISQSCLLIAYSCRRKGFCVEPRPLSAVRFTHEAIGGRNKETPNYDRERIVRGRSTEG